MLGRVVAGDQRAREVPLGARDLGAVALQRRAPGAAGPQRLTLVDKDRNALEEHFGSRLSELVLDAARWVGLGSAHARRYRDSARNLELSHDFPAFAVG